ncbi:MAG: alpha/beta hydrolase [Tissierellia bacterium]|nr:alpha/beta hydrolase [Tissierellia bacterium]
MADRILLSQDGLASLDLLTMPLYEEKSPWLNKKKPALIIAPGGSYKYCSDREGLPVAFKFLSKGYQCFVLNYHCGDQSDYPSPFKDLARAVKYVKDHKDYFGIDQDQISLLGFSAGGHLVGTYGALIDKEEFQKDMGLTRDELKVKNLILAYPAIHLKPLVEAVEKTNYHDQVGKLFTSYEEIKDGYAMAHKDMPRTFIFHAIDDDLVPVGLTLDYLKRLLDLGVDVEFYMPSQGGHGFATGDDLSNYGRKINSRISIWTDLVDEWIKAGMKNA